MQSGLKTFIKTACVMRDVLHASKFLHLQTCKCIADILYQFMRNSWPSFVDNWQQENVE